MSDLNETILPSVWSLARRALAKEPAQSLDDLIGGLTPAGLIKRSGDAASQSRHVGPSLRKLLELGIITEEAEGMIVLTDPAADEQDFRYAVAKAMLAVPPGDDPWEVRQDSTRLEYHLEAAVAWTQLLGLDSGISNWQSASEVLDQQFTVNRPLLRDTAPYNTLERLATWLGATTVLDSRLVPDPTPLVRASLDTILPEGSCTAGDFLKLSAEEFPWLPHGDLGRAVAAEMREVPDKSAADGRFPECLSLALVRLELEDVIELDPGDDPRTRVLLSFHGEPERGVAKVQRK